MELWEVKMLCIVSLLGITLLCGTLPIKVSELSHATGEAGAYVLRLLHCLSGGVFLGTFLLHLLPEAAQLTNESLPSDADFPVSETIAALAMFLMLFMEQVLMMIGNKQEKRIRRRSGLPLPPATPPQSNVSPQPAAKHDGADSAGGRSYGSLDESDGDDHGLVESRIEGQRKLERTRVVILVVALSVHSLFEGLAMGLQDSRAKVWSLFLAITTHKCVIAFSTGLQLAQVYSPAIRPILVSIVVYATMSPFGASVGTVVIHQLRRSARLDLNMVNGVLQSIATGTFMYITFFEILVKSLSSGGGVPGRGSGSLVQLGAVILGFGVMAGLAVLH